jgi:hypothetical protein
MSDAKKQDEARRLARALEAFAYAAGLTREQLVAGLAAVGLAASQVDPVSPYRKPEAP